MAGRGGCDEDQATGLARGPVSRGQCLSPRRKEACASARALRGPIRRGLRHDGVAHGLGARRKRRQQAMLASAGLAMASCDWKAPLVQASGLGGCIDFSILGNEGENSHIESYSIATPCPVEA